MINIQEGGAPAEANVWNRPAGLTWHGYLVQLLHIASSIEHALLVQYLYAAYSLSSENLSQPDDLNKVNVWRNLILSIAKEEMGHLATVQNLLRFLGAPLALDREDGCQPQSFARAHQRDGGHPGSSTNVRALK